MVIVCAYIQSNSVRVWYANIYVSKVVREEKDYDNEGKDEQFNDYGRGKKKEPSPYDVESVMRTPFTVQFLKIRIQISQS